MDTFDYLIVGGGLTAASAVDGIREHDEQGTVAIVTDESEPPYHRPPLSKEFLQNPEASRELLHVKPEGWFEEKGVRLVLEQRALSLDPRERKVVTARGNEYRGERILLATGGRARTLPLPGTDLAGVHTLRTVDDSEGIREEAEAAEDAVLVGAGFIGMELAASLAAFEIRSTVTELAERAWARLLPRALSDWMEDYFRARGVRFRFGSQVKEFRGSDGRLESAVLVDGTEVSCQLAVIGVGIEPNTTLAADAGLAVQDGIIVDQYAETSHPHVYAAGDVARFPDPVFGDSTRVEHWDHAKAHGRLAGRNMAGKRDGYDHLSYFFSDVFDLSLNVFGRPAGAEEVVLRGELGEGPAIAFTAADGRVSAAILFGAGDQMDACREIIRRRPAIDDVRDDLGDPSVELSTLVPVAS